MVKFTSLNKAERTVTFDVDEKPVTRKIPAQFAPAMETVIIDDVPVTQRVRPGLSDTDDYLAALAAGLQVEADAKPVVKVIDTPTAKAGDVLADVAVAVK